VYRNVRESCRQIHHRHQTLTEYCSSRAIWKSEKGDREVGFLRRVHRPLVNSQRGEVLVRQPKGVSHMLLCTCHAVGKKEVKLSVATCLKAGTCHNKTCVLYLLWGGCRLAAISEAPPLHPSPNVNPCSNNPQSLPPLSSAIQCFLVEVGSEINSQASCVSSPRLAHGCVQAPRMLCLVLLPF